MKTTTTPGGATLVWLEAGDTLQRNDVCEIQDCDRPYVVRNETEDGDLDTFLDIGHVLTAEQVAVLKPRRYIPATE